MSVTSEIDFDEDIEVINGIEAEEIPIAMNEAFYDFIDPRLVYSNSNLGEICEGTSFMIKGTILPNCERFSVNFIINTPTRDIALHLNPRLPQNYIVRNSKIKGKWGKEEIPSPYPFCLERGNKFSLQILIIHEEFLICINGKHFARFKHRLPFQKIMCLEVKGDVDNIDVEHKQIQEYPTFTNETEPKLIDTNEIIQPSIPLLAFASSTILMVKPEKGWGSKIINDRKESGLEMPYYGKLSEDNGFLIGKRLCIEGRVKILPHSFYINLQDTHFIWPHPLIAFHLNPRFANIGGKHVICHNSWCNDKWNQEQRTEMKTDFMPGRSFTLWIYCTNTGFEVYLNEKFLTEYTHHLRPQIIRTVFIQGDIILWKVVLEDGSTVQRDRLK